MNQEDAFLQDIREHPLDDVPRLVYADWLEERDDPRSRYLRVEVELSRLTEDVVRYAVLEAELQELRATIESEWLEQAGKRYELVLHSHAPTYKIYVIKVIRELTSLGLKECVDLVEFLPSIVLADVSRSMAEFGREQLRYASGKQIAEVDVRVSSTAPSTSFGLLLQSYPAAQKIAVIKAVRELLGCGLREAKDRSEAPLPVMLQSGLSREQAERGLNAFRGIALVTVRAM
jgi:uncharacterized protein (TIGR02996 family)